MLAVSRPLSRSGGFEVHGSVSLGQMRMLMDLNARIHSVTAYLLYHAQLPGIHATGKLVVKHPVVGSVYPGRPTRHYKQTSGQRSHPETLP